MIWHYLLTISRYWYRTMFDEHFPSYCASTVMRWTPTWSKQTDPSGRYACPYWLVFNYENRSTNRLTTVQLQSTKTNTTKQNENFRLPRLSRSLLYKSVQISLEFSILTVLRLRNHFSWLVSRLFMEGGSTLHDFFCF